ncbi:MFS transporter [Ideonella sp. DXS29W]|uniref:MFS transporter n=1 Tax=Ideonella lacteola TaxID=2984193 RepID=A0ABU9BND8_9BURK
MNADQALSRPAPAPASTAMQGVTPGLSYGLLGLPLAFVALPLYVQLPPHYASTYGVPLASLGLLLLAVRVLDALVDPGIGRLVDRLLDAPAGWRLAAAGGAATALALAFHALFFPRVEGTGPLLAWAGITLTAACLGYSGLSVLHQAWGARLGGDPTARARVVAWREGAGLLGVVTASVLPGVLGLGAAAAALAATLALGVMALRFAPAPQPMETPSDEPSVWVPWQWHGFRRLLGLYLLNGVASALPATLVLFYIRDRLQWPGGEPWLLGLYFCAAAVSLPVWVRLIARLGLARAWAAGMGLSIVSFAGAAVLGPGDGAWFAAVCAASGLALGADLCVPPAMLAGELRQPGRHADGVAFGWWHATTKLNLALAAGVALPLLQWLGYQPGQADPAGQQALALVYALLPCALKLAALAALWLGWIRHREYLETST